MAQDSCGDGDIFTRRNYKADENRARGACEGERLFSNVEKLERKRFVWKCNVRDFWSKPFINNFLFFPFHVCAQAKRSVSNSSFMTDVQLRYSTSYQWKIYRQTDGFALYIRISSLSSSDRSKNSSVENFPVWEISEPLTFMIIISASDLKPRPKRHLI